jgi:hypothetical protein
MDGQTDRFFFNLKGLFNNMLFNNNLDLCLYIYFH